jgi:VWFA-related protein
MNAPVRLARFRPAPAALAFALAALPAGLDAQAPAPSPQATFPTGTELVTVDAVVVDQSGRPVSGLEPGDFTVLEDGRPRPIESFERVEVPERALATEPARPRASSNTAPPAPRTFVIVFDELHLGPFTADASKAAIEKFLREDTRPGDRVTLVPTDTGTWWTDTLPEGLDDLVAVLRRMEGKAPRAIGSDYVTPWEAMRIHVHRDDRVSAAVQRRFAENGAIPGFIGGGGLGLGEGHPLVKARAADVYQNSVARRRSVLRTLDAAIESLVGTRGRKAVLLVSEGFVHEPGLVEMHRAFDAARRANTAVHFVDARGLAPTDSTIVAEGRLLQAAGSATGGASSDLGLALDQERLLGEGTDAVAAETGGESFKNSNDLSRGLVRLARESSTYYLLGYAPDNMKRDGRFRKIEVRVNRPGAEVRARRGYMVPRETDLQERVAEGRDPRLPAPPPPGADTSTLPLRLAAYALHDVAGGKVKVVLAAEADAASFAWEARGDRFEDALDTTVVLVPRGAKEPTTETRLMELSLPADVKNQVTQDWLPVLREFELAPGVYQARVVVRERNGGRAGTVQHVFEVPAAGVFRTTTPVLTDMLQPTASGAPRPSLLARRTFVRGGRLFTQFEVVNAAKDAAGATRVSTGHVLRRRDGTVLSEQAPAPLAPGPDGRLARMLAIGLRSTAPGPHEIVFRVKDEVSGRQWETVEPFEVADAPAASAAR